MARTRTYRLRRPYIESETVMKISGTLTLLTFLALLPASFVDGSGGTKLRVGLLLSTTVTGGTAFVALVESFRPQY